MKVLRIHDLSVEGQFHFFLEGVFDHQADIRPELEPFFQALESWAGDWLPDAVKGRHLRRYSRASAWKALKESRDEDSMSIGLHRTMRPALDMSLSLHFPPLEPRLAIWVNVQPLSAFNEECSGAFVDMVRAWASAYPVTHASGSNLAEDQLSGAPLFGRDTQTFIRDGFDKLYEVSWLNVFGPKIVEAVGRERVLSTPAHRVEALPNGAILLVTWPTAADFALDEARQAQARALVHLRPELDFDSVLRSLRERSAALVPVTPRFPPDVAPLLSRVVDQTALAERQRKISGFNAWRPPEPEEWLPAESALPPDGDSQQLRAQYGYLSERLVALLHTEVPSVFTQSPESLCDIDAHLWGQNFPESFERENIDAHALPAVGAYLGQVLVRHLGGQWLPRRNPLETQVRVGSRVWLPMLRAQRFLRSRQSLLTHSLTQLYRVAERQR